MDKNISNDAFDKRVVDSEAAGSAEDIESLQSIKEEISSEIINAAKADLNTMKALAKADRESIFGVMNELREGSKERKSFAELKEEATKLTGKTEEDYNKEVEKIGWHETADPLIEAFLQQLSSRQIRNIASFYDATLIPQRVFWDIPIGLDEEDNDKESIYYKAFWMIKALATIDDVSSYMENY